MIKVNTFRITPSGNTLTVDIEISDLEYFDQRTIESVTLDFYNSSNVYPSTPPSSKAITFTPNSGTIEGMDYEFKSTEKSTGTPADNRRFTLTVSDITEGLGVDPTKTLFYIYVEEAGDLADGTPCGYKNNETIAVAYSNKALYLKGIDYIKGMGECTPNRAFTDYMLEKRAFEIALALGHHQQAYNWWISFFAGNNTTISTTSTCGCHA